MKQPLLKAIVELPSDTFWNWIADEIQADLHGLELVDAREEPDGTIQFLVQNVNLTEEQKLAGSE